MIGALKPKIGLGAKHSGGRGRATLALVVSHLRLNDGPLPVLRGLSFEVVQGSITAIIGGAGAGKTALLQIITGLIRPAAGSVRFRGQELVGLPSHRIYELGIAHVAEGRSLFPTLSVRENLELGARADQEPQLDRVLALFPGLAEGLDQDVGLLSAAKQQMVTIGRALMAKPDVILFDEPTRGMPRELARQLFQLIGTLATEDMTIILADQPIRAALRLADAAHILEQGRVVRSGSGLELLEQAQGRQADQRC
jgi:branched-chain amino acid transport system ATP-binding protein